jgi:NADPH-dependent ferric siderophore reductase
MKKIFALMALAVSVFAGINAGHPFPSLTLEDQFKKSHTITPEEQMVLISFERSVSNSFTAFMDQQPKGFLAGRNTLFISDISAMPTLISKMFALPKMQKYNYTALLNYEDAFDKQFEKQEGKLTLYRLEGGKVASVEFITPDRLPELFK